MRGRVTWGKQNLLWTPWGFDREEGMFSFRKFAAWAFGGWETYTMKQRHNRVDEGFKSNQIQGSQIVSGVEKWKEEVL